MKKIRFNRVEFVREYYTVEWTEEDYKSTLEWLSKRDDAHSIAAYGALKDLSFDDIVAILNDEKDDIDFKVVHQVGTDREWSYCEYVGDFIRDMIREDCWNVGCYESECEDSEEDLTIETE